MTRLKQIWIGIKDSFWFIPTIINLFVVAFAFFVIKMDRRIGELDHPFVSQYFKFQVESIRTFLATIAGSMMTIAGVVFSITILVLAQTAGQYSSRVLRNFMRNKTNQIILGVFVGIFVFCLFLITNLHPTDNGLTVLSGLVFALVGVGLLIYYIHETSVSIQASEIIRNIQVETVGAIVWIYPNLCQNEKVPEVDFDCPFSVASLESGYLQAINVDLLLEIAQRENMQIRSNKKIGDFVGKGVPLYYVERDLSKNEELCTQISNCFIVGKYRTATQDVAFGIQQIVDIALRGLSSGMNDLSTVQTSIDYLTSIYIELANRDYNSPVEYAEDHPYLYIPKETFCSFLEMGLKVICLNSKGHPAIHKYILDSVQDIKSVINIEERKEILEKCSCLIN